MIYLLKHNPDEGCRGCPGLADGMGVYDDMCRADQDQGALDLDDEEAPDWCPLRTGAIAIARDEDALNAAVTAAISDADVWMGDEGDEPS